MQALKKVNLFIRTVLKISLLLKPDFSKVRKNQLFYRKELNFLLFQLFYNIWIKRKILLKISSCKTLSIF